jgi:manganese-dependent inorganic pyrophosphatase
MLNYMEQVCEENHYDFDVLLLTDVINANSEVFVAGSKPHYVEQAFNVKLVDQEANLPGVISRKKQVVPALTEAING